MARKRSTKHWRDDDSALMHDDKPRMSMLNAAIERAQRVDPNRVLLVVLHCVSFILFGIVVLF